MRRGLVIFLLCALALTACGGDTRDPSAEQEPPAQSEEESNDEPARPESSPCPEGSKPTDIEFDPAKVLIDTQSGSVLIDSEVADNDRKRARGLMDRTCLEPDAGMVFIFFQEVNVGFWMKDTKIPLSIAYFDADGIIVDIQDMEPCPESETLCPSYEPAGPYMGALEVNEGAFEEWGVEVGDHITVTR